MRFHESGGSSLIQLLIVILAVSVVATAVWNLQTTKPDPGFSLSYDFEIEQNVRDVLDDIKYHLSLAGYGMDDDNLAIEIVREKYGDNVSIRHNGICFNYFVDDNNNLIKQVESTQKVLASNIKSINTTETRSDLIVVTISTMPDNKEEYDGVRSMSKSYSVAVNLKNKI